MPHPTEGGGRTHLLIRYRVRPDAVPRHLELLSAVRREFAREPPDVRWETYRLDDGVSFVDLVAVERPGVFSSLSSWAAYRGTLDERCDEPPVMTELHPVPASGPE